MLRVAPLVLLMALAPAQCSSKEDPRNQREETAGDGLWALAEDFHAKGNEEAYKSTLRFLATRYPSGRRAAAAREVLGSPESPPASSRPLMRAPLPRLIAITDRALASEQTHLACYERLAQLMPRGSFAVQLREPGAGADALARFGERLLSRLSPLGVRLFINDRLDVALSIGVRNAHLGRRSVGAADARRLLGEDALVSRACHADPEVGEAAREGADAALLSPVFASPGKGPGLGVRAIAEARVRGVALFALGGVDGGNAVECLAAGADGVAVIRAALDQGSLEALSRALR